MIKTVYFGGCWSTNVGNAFIDFGALQTCSKYNPFLYSEYNASIMFKENRSNYLNTFVNLKPSCAFFSGMVACPEFISDQAEIIQQLDKLGIPIVFNGIGGETFTDREVEIFRDFIRKHKIAGFISRDDVSFAAYADLFPSGRAFRGIDVAFFMQDVSRFQILRDLPKPYTVMNEDDLGFSSSPYSFPACKKALEAGSLVYTHHQLTDMPHSYLTTPRSMLAELPDEFVALYAQAKTTFTTRVHACIATLTFGGECILLYDTPRAMLFERVGCADITKKLCSLDMDLLKTRKAEHMSALESIMKQIGVTSEFCS